jgi:hypothetical protein
LYMSTETAQPKARNVLGNSKHKYRSTTLIRISKFKILDLPVVPDFGFIISDLSTLLVSGWEEGGDDVKSAWPFDALGYTHVTMAITTGCEAVRRS